MATQRTRRAPNIRSVRELETPKVNQAALAKAAKASTRKLGQSKVKLGRGFPRQRLKLRPTSEGLAAD